MPSDGQQFAEDDPQADPHIRDWTELFQIFQERDELRPHHNIEVKGLFAQDDMQEGGEVIFYYQDLGSFWLTYDQESYQNDVAASGVVEPREELAEFARVESIAPRSSYGESNTDIENQRKVYGGHNYLHPPQHSGWYSGSELYCEIELPKDFNRQKVVSTIQTGENVLEWMKESFCSGELEFSDLADRLDPK